MRFSHIQSPLFYLLCFLSLTLSICLLWKLSLSLALPPLSPIRFTPCCPLPRRLSIRIVLPASFLFADPFLIPYLRLPPCAIPLTLLLIWPARTPGRALKKQRKSKNKLVTAIPVDKTQADLKHSAFSFPHFFPLAPPLLFLLHLGVSFSHTILFLSIHHLLLYQFSNSVLPLQREPCPRPRWTGESVAVGRETCASKVPPVRQMSVADSECPHRSSGILCGSRSAML